MLPSGNLNMISNEEREIHKGAQDIINQISVILRNAQIHNPGNIAVTTAIERFLSLLNQLTRIEKSLVLELVGEYFYCDDVRVRYALEHLLNFDYLVREFKRREIGKIVFSHGVGPQDVQVFLKAFIAAGFSPSPFDTISGIMSGVEKIHVDILKKIKEG